MRANEYQRKARVYAKYGRDDYPFLALGEEAGEVLGKLAKYVRKNNVSLSGAIEDAHLGIGGKGFELYADLVKELGDVLWQVSACCNELGVDLEHVMQANLSKLDGRFVRGTLVGAGDER